MDLRTFQRGLLVGSRSSEVIISSRRLSTYSKREIATAADMAIASCPAIAKIVLKKRV